MGKLLQNERIKLYKRPSTWVLSGILVGLMLVSVVFVKLIALGNASYSPHVPDWREEYAREIRLYQAQAEEYPEDTYQKVQLEKYRYLLEKEIPPTDWRLDTVEEYFETLAAAEEAEAALALNPGDPALKQEAADYRKLAADYARVLDGGDWKALLNLQIDAIRAGKSIGGLEIGQTEKERAALVEVLTLQIDLNIPPVPQTLDFYYHYDNPNEWKIQALSTLQENKLALLRGEKTSPNLGNSQPLTASARAALERETAVLTEQLRTGSRPVEEDSFLGMLDSTTGNLGLISLLVMVLAGGIVANEFGTGTVKLLLITPHRRRKIYWAKALLLLEVTGLILGAMFVLSFLISACFNGFGGIGQRQVVSLFGQIVRLPFLLVIVLKYLLCMLPVLAYGALSFMLSAVTRKSAVAIAVSLILMYGGQLAMQIVVVASSFLLGGPLPGLKFLLFANDNLTQYLPSVYSSLQITTQANLAAWDSTMSLGFSVAILLVYTVCFLWIGRDSFCRRDIQ